MRLALGHAAARVFSAIVMSVNLGRNAGTATPALWAGVTSREELAAADAALCARLGFATFELEAGGASS